MFYLVPGHVTHPPPKKPQFAVAQNLIKAQGVGSLYKGLSAGLLRQATYTTARLVRRPCPPAPLPWAPSFLATAGAQANGHQTSRPTDTAQFCPIAKIRRAFTTTSSRWPSA